MQTTKTININEELTTSVKRALESEGFTHIGYISTRGTLDGNRVFKKDGVKYVEVKYVYAAYGIKSVTIKPLNAIKRDYDVY